MQAFPLQTRGECRLGHVSLVPDEKRADVVADGLASRQRHNFAIPHPGELLARKPAREEADDTCVRPKGQDRSARRGFSDLVQKVRGPITTPRDDEIRFGSESIPGFQHGSRTHDGPDELAETWGLPENDDS